MSLDEFMQRILLELRPMLPALAASVILTLLVVPALMKLCRGTWVRTRGFRISGLFFGLDARDVIGLACAWLRLIFILVFIVGFQKLVLLSYWMFILPGAIGVLCAKAVSKKLSRLLWLFLQTAGLLSVNLICGYIRDMDGGTGFFVIYVTMGIFLALFSIYISLMEAGEISDGRGIDAGKTWSRRE